MERLGNAEFEYWNELCVVWHDQDNSVHEFCDFKLVIDSFDRKSEFVSYFVNFPAIYTQFETGWPRAILDFGVLSGLIDERDRERLFGIAKNITGVIDFL
jgi:hypothetical protein